MILQQWLVFLSNFFNKLSLHLIIKSRSFWVKGTDREQAFTELLYGNRLKTLSHSCFASKGVVNRKTNPAFLDPLISSNPARWPPAAIFSIVHHAERALIALGLLNPALPSFALAAALHKLLTH